MKLIDIIKEQRELINESGLTEKDIKKCKILWKTFHKGKIKYNDKVYKYELKDDYDIVKIPLTNKPNINIRGNSYDIISIWEMQDNGHGIYMDYDLHNTIHWKIKEVLNKKFESFNVGTNL